MKLRRAALALATSVAFVPAGPAHAAEPTVQSDIGPAFTRWITEERETVLAGGVCKARGDGGSAPSTWVAVSTQVRCSVNGTQRSASVAGPEAVTEIVVAATPPVVMCHGGSAIFMDPADGGNELIYVTVPDHCYVMPS